MHTVLSVSISLTEEEMVNIIAYEYAERRERPNLSGAEIRSLLYNHFREVSRSRVDYMEEDLRKRVIDWAKRVVKGKGFHLNPRKPRW